MATDLVCPKCQGLMRTYERSGVTLDQCADCRGIFLDRGELEHLVDAELGWQRGHSAPRERERDRSYERERDPAPASPTRSRTTTTTITTAAATARAPTSAARRASSTSCLTNWW